MEELKALSIVRKLLWPDQSKDAPRRNLEAWALLGEMYNERLTAPPIHPIFKPLIDPFKPHQPTDEEKEEFFKEDSE